MMEDFVVGGSKGHIVYCDIDDVGGSRGDIACCDIDGFHVKFTWDINNICVVFQCGLFIY